MARIREYAYDSVMGGRKVRVNWEDNISPPKQIFGEANVKIEKEGRKRNGR